MAFCKAAETKAGKLEKYGQLPILSKYEDKLEKVSPIMNTFINVNGLGLIMKMMNFTINEIEKLFA